MTILKNILSFTGLVVGAPSVQAHLLNINDIALIPRIMLATGGGYTITADSTNVTVTRLLGAGAAVDVYCELWHSIEDAEPRPSGILSSLFPVIVQGGGSPSATVVTDSTMTGDGSAGSPLGVSTVDGPFGGTITSINATLVGAQTDDWNPAGFATAPLIRTTTPTALHVLTGMIAAVPGTLKIIQNHGDGVGIYGTSPLVLSFRNLSSVVTNRFIGPGLTDLVLQYADAALCYYDGGAAGWMVLGVATSNNGRFDLLRAADIQIAPAITPAALAAGDTSDYAPTGYSDSAVWRVNANAAGSTLTGLVPPVAPSWWTIRQDPTERKWGAFRCITNIGAGVLTLANERTSAAPNQFNLPNAVDFGIASLASVILIYDETASRWKLYAGTNVFNTMDTMIMRGTITDTLAIGNTNNYNPSGLGGTSVLRLIPDGGGSALTGITAQQPGRRILLAAYGSTLTLMHQSGSSLAANRFYLKGGANRTLQTGEMVELFYDVGNTSWLVLG
jgi:hypothetical protein